MNTTTTADTTRLTTRTWSLFAPSATTLANERVAEPLRWSKAHRAGINGDLFHEDVPDAYLDQVFAVMALTPHITYQVLTKRPERMRIYLFDGSWDEDEPQEIRNRIKAPIWPLPNVWLGVSGENQEQLDARVPDLLATPAAVRFLSCEPLLEGVGIRHWMGCEICHRPAPARARDPWEVLGLRPGADREDVEAMYKAKAKRLHPDLGGSEEAMAELNAAYEAVKG